MQKSAQNLSSNEKIKIALIFSVLFIVTAVGFSDRQRKSAKYFADNTGYMPKVRKQRCVRLAGANKRCR